MDFAAAGRVRVRATSLWLTVTAAQAGLVALTAPSVRGLVTAPGPTFADALVQACAAAALVAGALLWLATTEVVCGVLRSRPSSRLSSRAVGPVRLALLAACGATVLATAPAHAGSDSPVDTGATLGAEALAGLPLPDRPIAPGGGAVTPAIVTVRAGDSLWSIAGQRLGPGASRTEVASYWLRLRALNADAVGPDPDLIQPGQTLRLPPA